MQEVFEKIKERLEERLKFYENRFAEMSGTDRDVEDWGSIKSYKDAIEIVNQVVDEYKSQNIDQDLTIVESLPSLYSLQPFEVEAIHRVVERAKYNNGWIPCSERLPNRTDLFQTSEYTVTMRFVKNRYKGIPFTSHASFDFESKRWLVKEYEVIAWQPLPEPYRGE